MQKKIKLKPIDVIGILVLLVLLVSVRVFQEQLFYDPLLVFFKTESETLAKYNSFKLFLGLLFRYTLNTLLSLGIIYILFKDKAILKLCTYLYIAFFIIFTLALFVIINADDVNLLLLFYVRRFIIQPLFLILFIPAFYYQKKLRE
ncbi:exosortase F system-associated protein [Flavobacterium suaedae]|uniref:Exosortase F system-associated protein n=1 Tax=Flavobacterium suaedae TaxID=1767027 RepID=A0ABQ1JNP5_9FLAO|nr:exosortase F system-associated protein [Flavobacterium suaedae]GGB70987.1 exosortase F system-associated protein [Flavobacterium suaedae]